ncbi:MAG TPA: hypothetical protein VFO77_11040 [Actinoplanes sp.]|nr:hypothetical protein [Actinoplanes sp.]
MQLLSLGSFLLPVRFALGRLLGGGRDDACAAIRTALPEFASLQEHTPSELLLDYHRSTGAQQMETMLFSGSVVVEPIGRVQVYVSSLGVGFVVVEHTLPEGMTVNLETDDSREQFKAYEAPLSAAVAPLIEDVSRRIAAAVPTAVTQPRPSVALPDGSLLWWHRIGLVDTEEAGFHSARWYGTTAQLADGVICRVGNGFTNLVGAGADVVGDVIEGLMIATQEWLVVDEAKRLIADHLVALSGSRQATLISVDRQYGEVLQLTEEVALRDLVLNEELRYLANARNRVKVAACEAWGTSVEAADLESRANSLRDLFALRRERIANNRDDRRNRYIFAFTALALVQASLVWYDFITEDDVTVSKQPRPTVAMIVLLITVLALGGALLSGPFMTWWRNRR